ncbi:hypothetical protein GGQ99_004792 [Aminobacter niigataensis]|uniref:Uncharacterized protein n=1 Tax=Aminobacter niigataensis TaxID=83265 RepID=A0ABR6L8T4_9HYPH|nr:hypothetical protein [Aminobacter niigataensis]MBB4653008.1 hypothetical protein [Aminobacter niigataensis]
MQLGDAFRRCLVELDVAGARALWREVSPHLRQPANDVETLFMLHRARTEAASIDLKLRAYSHRWLVDNGYPSGLPDTLRPRAERLYPRVVDAVGVCVRPSSSDMIPLAKEVERAMSDAIADAYAEGRKYPEFVRARMLEARAATRKKLLGIAK